jgi:multidrug efflux pump subunit AcrB
MLTLLMIQLQSFSRLLLVFLTAPLGIIGASLGLNVANQPFGFVALLGLIALAGMIMRNAVILVDQIETDVAHGLTRKEAIVEATVRRARPVVLTALAAILAMVALGVLGPDGDHHHGRLVCCNLPNLAVPAGPLCPLVPQEP